MIYLIKIHLITILLVPKVYHVSTIGPWSIKYYWFLKF